MVSSASGPPIPGVLLRWLGQAGFVISGGHRPIIVDPWLSDHPLRAQRPPALADLPDDIGWLLATHEHPDHLDLAALPGFLARYPAAEVVVPTPLADRVIAASPGARVHPVQPGDRLPIGDATLTVVHAWHGIVVSDGYSDGHGLTADGLTPFVGFVLKLPGGTVYHAGDTLARPALVEEILPLRVDVALLPVNGRDARRESAGILGNMDAREAVAFAAAVGARLMVPMHFDMVHGNRVPAGRTVGAAQAASPPLSILIPARGIDVRVGVPERPVTRSGSGSRPSRHG